MGRNLFRSVFEVKTSAVRKIDRMRRAWNLGHQLRKRISAKAKMDWKPAVPDATWSHKRLRSYVILNGIMTKEQVSAPAVDNKEALLKIALNPAAAQAPGPGAPAGPAAE